jgi:hypothetical protein
MIEGRKIPDADPVEVIPTTQVGTVSTGTADAGGRADAVRSCAGPWA